MKPSLHLSLFAALCVSLLITTSASARLHKGRVLVVVSAASSIPLLEGGEHPTGIFLGELTEPVEALLKAGYTVTFASPQGKAPTIDRDSLRGIYWKHSKLRVKEAKEIYKGLSALNIDHPLELEALVKDEAKLNQFDALFVPGGHGPLVDLYYQDMFKSKSLNATMGRLLLHFHQTKKPTGLICHAPAVLVAAPSVGGKWIYEGYKITAISRFTEWLNEDMPGFKTVHGHVGEYPSEILKKAGAKYLASKIPMRPYVVEDRELITGQDPFSARLFAKRFVQFLDKKITR